MEFLKTQLDGVMLVKPDIHDDFRGGYIETYNDKLYKENGITADFVQDDMSYSFRNVLRGIHSDDKISKLISCPLGKFYLVIVNCDEDSENFGKWESFVLSDRNYWQVYAPAKHGIAHLVLSEEAIFFYKQSGYYNPSQQKSFRFDDPRFNIWWPIKNPILSKRDEFASTDEVIKK